MVHIFKKSFKKRKKEWAKNIRRAGYVRTCQAKGIASRKVLNSVYG